MKGYYDLEHGNKPTSLTLFLFIFYIIVLKKLCLKVYYDLEHGNEPTPLNEPNILNEISSYFIISRNNHSHYIPTQNKVFVQSRNNQLKIRNLN